MKNYVKLKTFKIVPTFLESTYEIRVLFQPKRLNRVELGEFAPQFTPYLNFLFTIFN